MDWNAVIYVLDELRDEPRSLLDLPMAFSRYERTSLLQNFLYLADQGLIQMSEHRYPFEPIPKARWAGRLREAFERLDIGSAAASVQTSETGQRVLQLLGIGHF